MTNQESLHLSRQYDSKYIGTDYGQPLQGFQRDQTIEKARDKSREDAKRLGRKCILIDVVKEYCIMAKHKLERIEYQPEMELKI